MKGKTNASASGGYENVNVHITSDQEQSVLIGVVVTITYYNGFTESKVWNGSNLLFKVPANTTYTITYSEVDKYITPVPYTSTAIAGNSVTLTGGYMYRPFYDLSIHDIYGNVIEQTTANCYIVKEADKYGFPLVYGNALKNGATNSAAYTKQGSSNTMNFVNYNNVQITSPYIETDTGLTVDGVEISTADTNGGLTDLAIVSGANCKYIQFTATSVPTVGANYVVSAKNGDTILWSWHIWYWPNDLTVKTLTNKTNVNYGILPVNLATKLDSASSLNATTGWKSWYYQWGRHVPMLPPATYNSTTDHTNYGVKTFTKSSSKASNYGVGIQNPQTYYCTSSSPHNWFGSSSYYNLWDAACTTTGNSDNVVVKTVYDPSPIGFHIPNGNTFTYFSTDNIVGSFSNGYTFKRNEDDNTGVFFPASGSRNRSNSSLVDAGKSGNYWLSSANSSTYAYFLTFDSDDVNPQNYLARSYGFPLRCVAE